MRSKAWLSLIPWATFLVVSFVAYSLSDLWTVRLGGTLTSAPWYLVFVALPALAPLAAARRRWMVNAVVVLTTAAAAVAGVLVATTDDAQAGLAVLWVPYVALPLSAVVCVVERLLPRDDSDGVDPS